MLLNNLFNQLENSGEARSEFLENRLSPEAIGAASFSKKYIFYFITCFYRYRFISIYGGGNPFLNYRSSGLETNLLTGNPTVALGQKAVGAIRSTGKSIIDDEYDFSKADAYKWLRILPYQNMLGIRNVMQYMIDESDLPRKSK